MPKIVVKVGKEEQTFENASVLIGARSSCQLVVSDPLAAPEHSEVMFAGGHFQIVDRGTTLGTFVDGEFVNDAAILKNGSTIVVGVSRVKVALDEDESGDSVLTLQLDKKYFYYDDKKDALDWSRKEVAFGRFPPLSTANWIVSFAVIILLPFWFWPPTSDPLLEPGPTRHSAMPAFHAQLENLNTSDRDCSACHSSFSGAPNSKCLVCHEEDVGKPMQHPFASEASAWSMDCAHCHVDHRGVDAASLIAVEAPDSCGLCHEADRKPANLAKLPRENREIPLAYRSFSHADHKGKKLDGRELACGDCHEPLGADNAMPPPMEGERPREFRPLTYEACLKCHGDKPDIPAERRFAGAWHGTDEDGKRCLVCHESLNEKELREGPRAHPSISFQLAAQAHDGLATGSEPKDCAQCHKNGEELAGGVDRGVLRFTHDIHVLSMNPSAGGLADVVGVGAAEPAKGTCAFCHSDIAKADSLFGPEKSVFSDQKRSCLPCHEGQAPKIVASPAPSPSLSRVAFPHDRHLAVEKGCFACHEFNDSDGPMDVTTPEKVRNCTECHDQHRNLGRDETHQRKDGACQVCHKPVGKDPDPVYAGKPFTWDRPSDPGFRHFSRGHKAPTNEGRCDACHDEETWTAASIDAVPIPTEDATRCRTCHIDERQRFHWR